MANKGDIFLGVEGVEKKLSPFGRRFTIRDEQILREGRTANGRLTRDIVAVKKEITLEYEFLCGSTLTDILEAFAVGDELSLLVYHASDLGGGTTTAAPEEYYDQYIVLMGSISRTRELTQGLGLWSGVSVILIEV